MSKTYKLIPPKHISEKMLAEYNIATLDEAQVDNLQFTSTINPYIRQPYSGPITPHAEYTPKIGYTIKIDGMCNPSGRLCEECTSNTQNTPADKAQHCLRQLADGKCKNPYVQRVLGKTLFPSKKYHKDPGYRIHKSILDLIKDSLPGELNPDIKLTPDMHLKNDLNFDSLDIVEIFTYIEDYYYSIHNIRFLVNEETIGEPQTVGDIIQIVNETISKQR